MKKRNKKYTPKRIGLYAHEMVLKLAKPIDEAAKITLSLDNYEAIDLISKGKGSATHLNVLSATVDVTLLMINELFDNKDLMNDLERARDGLIRARQRYLSTQKALFDGQAYNAMKMVCDVYKEAINNITCAELMAFYRARHLAINNGNYYKGEKIDISQQKTS